MAPLTSLEQYQDYYSQNSACSHSVARGQPSQLALPIRAFNLDSATASGSARHHLSSTNDIDLFTSLVHNPGAVHRCSTISRNLHTSSPSASSSQAEYFHTTTTPDQYVGSEDLDQKFSVEYQNMTQIDRARRKRYQPEPPKSRPRSRARSRSKSYSSRYLKRTSSPEIPRKTPIVKRPRITRNLGINYNEQEVIELSDSDDHYPPPVAKVDDKAESPGKVLRALCGNPSPVGDDIKSASSDGISPVNKTAHATIDRLTRELAAEKGKNRVLTEECDDLQRKVQSTEGSPDRHIRLELENEALQRKLETLEAQHATQQQESATLLSEALTSAQIAKDESLSLRERLSEVESQNHHMQQELTTLNTTSQATHPSVFQAPAAAHHALSLPSPAPSSHSSSFSTAMASSVGQLDEETKENNVRKMYMKTKRQYDVLHALCNNLVTCTRSIELSSFGEFGGYVRQLRDCLS